MRSTFSYPRAVDRQAAVEAERAIRAAREAARQQNTHAARSLRTLAAVYGVEFHQGPSFLGINTSDIIALLALPGCVDVYLCGAEKQLRPVFLGFTRIPAVPRQRRLPS